MEFSNEEVEASSCNIIDSSRSNQKRRCCNRFSCYRSRRQTTALPLMAAFTFLVLLPYFAQANFELAETSLRENLEETIRHSVKTEIEMEQDVDSATVIDALKDVPETEVSQQLNQEILSIDYQLQNAIGQKTINLNQELEKSQKTKEPEEIHSSVSSTDTLINDIQLPQTNLTRNNDNNLTPSHEISVTAAKSLPLAYDDQETAREARNLDNEIEQNIISTADTKDEDNLVAAGEKLATIEVKGLNMKPPASEEATLTQAEETAEMPKIESDLSTSGNSIESGNYENSLNAIETQPQGEETTNSLVDANHVDRKAGDAQTPASVAPIVPDAVETSTTVIPPNEDEALSFVLDETLSATELPILAEEQQLQDFGNFEETFAELEESRATTIAPVEEQHIVIKKPGVVLSANEETALVQKETFEAGSGTTVASVEQEPSDDQPAEQESNSIPSGADHPLEFPAESEPIYTTAAPYDSKDLEIGVDTPFETTTETFMDPITITVQLPEMQTELALPTEANGEANAEANAEAEAEKNADAEAEANAESNAEPNAEANAEAESEKETAVFDEASGTGHLADTVATNTSKGSRSINIATNTLANGDEVAATLFEAFPPHNAGQTFNDNLAAESSGEIGKALLTRSVSGNGEDSANHSTLIIMACSSIALLFIIVSLTLFLISFQRQHGTLDIEMQEQRCGKDDLDEEGEANTCTKLLEVELPTLQSIAADEIDHSSEATECL